MAAPTLAPLTALTPQALGAYDTIIDVRAPAEFAIDHIPGAISLPVLDDAQRAEVGTVYVQESPFLARKIGAALVARNAARHIEESLRDKPGDWRPLVYCWRGGQRSGAMATILAQIGWRVSVLEGGYRSYRRLVVGALYDGAPPGNLVMLDGNTGTGKTALLHLMAARGHQVLDLEALAAHRGSLFGSTGPQPAQKGFESALATELAAMDPARPILVEAESSRIGDLTLPPALWQAMIKAPRVEITAPLDARIAFTQETYAEVAADRKAVAEKLAELAPFHGWEKIDAWQSQALEGADTALIQALLTEHYDPRYSRSRARRSDRPTLHLTASSLDQAGLDAAASELETLLSRVRH